MTGARKSRSPAATGRILIWRGGSLWIGRGGEPAAAHAHHAIQVSVAFPGDQLRLRAAGGPWRAYTAALVAAQQRHEFDARGQGVVQLFVEPESHYGAGLKRHHLGAGIVAIAPDMLEPEIAALIRAYRERADDSTLVNLAQTAIARLAGTAPGSTPIDHRVLRAIDFTRARLGGTIRLDEVASRVHLSPERFRHLFVEQTGVRFRAYLLWLRLEQALAAYVGGQSITAAAQAGGFADSAHLSRTFRRMFGISAASIQIE